jgi:hypothetical protein
MISTITKTAEKLAEMFTENTGTNMLDSGGSSGRHWQRNAGKTAADFLAAPQGQNDWLSISAFHLCNKFLTYSNSAAIMTRQFQDWVSETEAYSNSVGSAVEFLTETLDIPESETRDFNTYNWENLLDQTLQGVEFELHGQKWVGLSIHGGADVRGGYSDIVFFQACECWLYHSDTVSLACGDCGLIINKRGPDVDGYHQDTGSEHGPDGYWDGEACFSCGSKDLVGFEIADCFC